MPNNIVPAPPPGPSILAGGEDPEADALLDQYMSNQAQQQAPQVAAQPQQMQQTQDPEADALLDQYMGITQNPPPPKAAVQAQTKTGLAKAPKPMISATIRRKSAGTQLQPPPPPKMQPWQVAGKQFISGTAQAADRFVGAVGKTAASLPIVGQAVAPMAQQAAMAQREHAQDPVGSTFAMLANAPRGILNLVDAAGNTAQRQLAQWGPDVHKNRIAVPFNLAGLYDSIPGMSTLQQSYPGQSATGQAVGASLVPIHAPVPIASPMLRGAVQGAVGGQALGTLESAGEQARHGNVDYGKAFQAGLPVAAMGAGLGVGMGVAGVGMGAAAKGLSKGFGKAAKTTAQAQTKVSGEVIRKPTETAAKPDIVMKDGSGFSTVEATKQLRDPATPPEVKQELRGLLEAKDKEFANAGLKERPVKPQEQPKSEEPAQQPEIVETPPAQEPVLEAPPAATEEVLSPTPTPESAATEGVVPPAAEPPVQSPFSKEHVPNEPYPDNIPGWSGELTGAKHDLDFKGAMSLPRGHGARQAWIDQYEPSLTKTGKIPKIEAGTSLGKLAQKYLDMGGKLDRETLVWLSLDPQRQAAHPDMKTKAFQDFENNVLRKPKDAAVEQPAYQPTAPDGYEMPAPQPKPQGDRFTVQKNTEKKGGYVDIIDSSTGEVISSSKRTEQQAAALAAKYNDLAVNAPDKLDPELRRGSKNLLDFRKTTDSVRNEIVDAGQDLPEGHALSEPLKAVAEAKQSFDESRARFEAATDAFYKLTSEKQGITMKRERTFSKKVEELVESVRREGGLDQLAIEVNNQAKLEPSEAPRFKRGMDPQEAYAMVENLYADMKAKEASLKDARKGVESDFLASDLGQSVNIPTANGKVNVRAVPKQGTELNTIAEELRGPVPNKEYVDRTISGARKIASKRGIKTRRNQRGSVRVAFRTPEAKPKAQPQPRTVEESLAEGAAESKEISDWMNDADNVRNLVTLRNTFDIAKEVSTDLHNELVVGIGKEALAAHGLEFKGDQAALAEQSLALEPWTIREGGTEQVDLSSMSDAQLNYLATRRSIRQRMAESVRDELTNMDAEYGSLDNMPNRVKGQYTTLQQLEQALSGFTPPSGTSEGGAIGIMRNAMYDYLFKWNGAYHTLNLADPFIVGSARVGINRVMAAKGLLMSDPAVRAYVKGVPNETPIQQMRKEVSLSVKTPKGVKAGSFTKLKQGVAKLQSKLPDLPSERWNFEDAWLAGVIERGDRIGYEGGGTQYARDLATGKLSPEEQIKLYADSMNTAQEITGSGSFGLNKDTIQRMGPMAKALTLFTSQPMRQARILSDLVTKDMKADPIDATKRILAFAAATTFFGGRALLPKETDLLEVNPTVRPFLRGVQDLLDGGKFFQEVPVIGRDLTDKVRWSMVPFLGGLQQNMLAGEIAKFARAFQGQKWDDAAKAGFFWALTAFAGGGGLEASKIDKHAAAAMAGDKDISAYPIEYIPGSGGNFPAKKKKFSHITRDYAVDEAKKRGQDPATVSGQRYDVGQAIKDSTLPGVDKRIGAFIKKARRDKIDKQK